MARRIKIKPDLPKRRKKSKPVRFEDIQLIRRAFKPPFDNDDGNYAEPDVVIAGGRVPAGVPKTLACPSSLVIYSSWAGFVPSCRGFGGVNDGDNAIVRIARANAQRLAAGIKCRKGCTKRVLEIWRGWSCGPEGKKFLAIAAVELIVVCAIEL